MFILLEVFFVLMVFAPLFIALPLAVSAIKQKVHVNYKAGIIAIFIIILIGMLFLPFSYTETHVNIVLVTALALGIYRAISNANRRAEYYSYIIMILFTGFLAFMLLFLLSRSSGYHDSMRSKAYLQKRQLTTEYLKRTLIKYAADKSFPAGYIVKNSAILTSLPASEEKHIEAKLLLNGYSWKMIPRWHSNITGLYYIDRQKVYLWYPGGKIKDKVDNIRWQKKSGE